MKIENNTINNILTPSCAEDMAKLRHDIKNSLGIILMRSEIISLQSTRTDINVEAIQISTLAIANEVKVICSLLDVKQSNEKS